MSDTNNSGNSVFNSSVNSAYNTPSVKDIKNRMNSLEGALCSLRTSLKQARSREALSKKKNYGLKRTIRKMLYDEFPNNYELLSGTMINQIAKNIKNKGTAATSNKVLNTYRRLSSMASKKGGRRTRRMNTPPRTPPREAPQLRAPPAIRRVRPDGAVHAAAVGQGPIQFPNIQALFQNPGPPGNSPGRNPQLRGGRRRCWTRRRR